MSMGMKGPRYRPQLAPVTESRQGSDALSLSSSLASEITNASTGEVDYASRQGSREIPGGAGTMEGNPSKPVFSPFEAASWGPEPDSPRERDDAAFSFHPWGRFGADSRASSMSADDSVSLQSSVPPGPADSMATSVASAVSAQSWASLPAAGASQGEGHSGGVQQATTPFASAAHVQSDEDDEDGGSFLSPSTSLDDSASSKSSPASSGLLGSMRSSSLALPPSLETSKPEGVLTTQQLPAIHTSKGSAGHKQNPLLAERVGSMQTAPGSALGKAFADALQDASSGMPGGETKTSGGKALANGLTAEERPTPVGLTRGSLDSPVARDLEDMQSTQGQLPPKASPTSGGLGGLESRRSLIFGQRPQDTRLDDAAVVSDIARTMNRLQTMSMPVQLLRSYSSSAAPPPLRMQVRIRFCVVTHVRYFV
jgi:hypothetical protein